MVSLEGEIDGALEELVGSMLGERDSEAISVSKRILGSSTEKSSTLTTEPDGQNEAESAASETRAVIAASAPAAAQQTVEHAANRLRRLCEMAGKSPMVADQAVSVLAKLANASSRTAATPPTPMASSEPSSIWPDRPQSGQTDQSSVPTDSTRHCREEERKAIWEMRDRETMLLRECLYVLQGIDGSRIVFDEESKRLVVFFEDEGIHRPELVAESFLGGGYEQALQECGEAGRYFRIVQSYVDRVEGSPHTGFVATAWARELAAETTKYLAFLADLESDLLSPDSLLTLRQLLVRLRNPTTRLRVLALVTDGLSSLRGGNLLSGLYKHSLHGDSRHASLIRSMLSVTTKPWFDTLYVWTTQGSLLDPHNEFFVSATENGSEVGRTNIRTLWNDGYVVVHDRVPDGIIDAGLINPILTVGKGINFIRKCLLDAEWVLEFKNGGSTDDTEGIATDTATDNATETEEDRKERLGYIFHVDGGSDRGVTFRKSKLHTTILAAEEAVNMHIVRSLIDRHHLMDHLLGLKQFLLLGQGDFFSAFTDSLLSEFKPGEVVYRHAVRGVVQTAINNTNASGIPSYVLERLDVELVHMDGKNSRVRFAPVNSNTKKPTASKSSNKQRERSNPGGPDTTQPGRNSVWDMVLFTYDTPDPIAAIVHDEAMHQYKQVFMLLFGLKRVEFLLNHTWRQSTALHHALQTFAQYNGIKWSTNEDYGKAITLLRRICMIRQSMMHFVVNLKSYLFFEVMEGAWKVLRQDIAGARSLDDIIRAHNSYLSVIRRKSLLPDKKWKDGQVSPGTELQTLLSMVRRCCEFQERTFTDAIAAAERATEKRREAERRTNAGDWGFSSSDDLKDEQTFFGLTEANKMDQVLKIANEFKDGTFAFLERLSRIVNGTASAVDPTSTPSSPGGDSASQNTMESQSNHDFFQFLAFQMDYNSSYYDMQSTN